VGHPQTHGLFCFKGLWDVFGSPFVLPLKTWTFPHCGGQSFPALPEKLLKEFEVN
jgi:hypothetical protein